MTPGAWLIETGPVVEGGSQHLALCSATKSHSFFRPTWVTLLWLAGDIGYLKYMIVDN